MSSIKRRDRGNLGPKLARLFDRSVAEKTLISGEPFWPQNTVMGVFLRPWGARERAIISSNIG